MKKNLLTVILVSLSFSFSFSQTSMVADINVGSANAVVGYLTTMNGAMYFNANDGIYGNELWKYDGINPPSLVADINPSGDSSPFDLIEFNGKLYFAADDGVTGFEMWEYDGVNPPTLLADIEASGNGAFYNGADFTVYNNKLYFRANDGVAGSELWEYDGINPPTLFADLFVGETGSGPISFTVYNNNLYFNATDESTGWTHLWEYDGVNSPYPVSTTIVTQHSPANMMKMNGKLYFGGNDGINGMELWEYDGVAPPTMTADIVSGSNSSWPAPKMAFDNKLYFRAQTVNPNENWVYDGVNPPTQEMTISPNGLEFNGDLYFSSDDGVNGGELWVYDAINPPSLVTNINPSGNSWPSAFHVFDSKLYFVADNGINGRELWVYNDVNSVSEKEVNINVKLFPNPSYSTISIETEAQINEVLIFNLSGYLVQRENRHNFSVENLSKGMYVIEITTKNGLVRSHFIKE